MPMTIPRPPHAPERRAAARSLAPLTRLRLQLTAWYLGTFALILLALGALLFAVIARQNERQLGDSLRAATREIARAAEIREREALSTGGSAVDAVEELRIPDRALYLFDIGGRLLTPDTASDAVRAAARRAAAGGVIDSSVDLVPERHLELHAERLTLPSGHRYVAVSVADAVELEDRYASLIATFAAAALAALVLVAVGGWLLARKSVEPVERNLAHMRAFMTDAAHELRTPIAVLRSRADVALLAPREPAAYVAALAAMGDEAERLGGIVDDLLTLARADAGERPLRRERVQLDEIVLDAVSGAGALAERRAVRLDVGTAAEAPIDADAVLVRQLVLIALDNALKFTPEGGAVHVDVRAAEGRATLEVRDSGPGIAADELPRIFDRFYRGESVRGSTSGAGLGLSIARWIADAHAAPLTVESVPGRGTTLRVAFPLAADG